MNKTLNGIIKNIEIKHYSAYCTKTNYLPANIQVWASLENDDYVRLKKIEGLDNNSIDKKIELAKKKYSNLVGKEIAYRKWKSSFYAKTFF